MPPLTRIALCATFVAGPLAAQAPAGPLPIQLGTWTYSGRVDQGVSARQDLDRVVTVSEAVDNGVPVFHVFFQLRDGDAVMLTDTVLVRRDNLAPVRRRSVADTLFDLNYVVRDSMITGSTRMPGRNGPISARLLPNTFLNYHAFRLMFRTLPMVTGLVDTAAMLLPRGDSGQVVPVTITVGPEERIWTQAGPCDCFVVLIQGETIAEMYWVDKVTRHVVRTREPFGGRGAVLQLDLVSFVPRAGP